MTKQIERHANQLTRIEKAITSLQKSVNKIDKQSNTIKQIYVVVTQLQRQIRSSKNRKQVQATQKQEVGKEEVVKKKTIMEYPVDYCLIFLVSYCPIVSALISFSLSRLSSSNHHPFLVAEFFLFP